MSFSEVTLASNIIDVSMSEADEDNNSTTIAVLTATDVTAYKWVFQGDNPGELSKIGHLRFSDQDCHDWELDTSRLFFQQITCSAQQERLFVLCSDSSGSSIVMTYTLGPTIQSIDLHIEAIPIKSFVRSISLTGPAFYSLSLDNQILALHAILRSSQYQTLSPFPKPVSRCVSMSIPLKSYMTNGNSAHIAEATEELIVFGLTTGGSLYANQRLLFRDCSSFLVTPAHLIFTTTQHLLKFVHLTNVECKVHISKPKKLLTDMLFRSGHTSRYTRN